MPQLTVNLSGVKELQDRLRQMNPKRNVKIPQRFFIRAAQEIQKNAKDKQISAGGRGKGKALKPLPHKLTSREGTLRRDISVDRKWLPWAIEIGPDIEYAAIHEFGGRISIPAVTVKAHRRTTAFGKKVAPFTVPEHTRRAHSASYPRRAFMAPALEAIRPRLPDILVDIWKKEARL